MDGASNPRRRGVRVVERGRSTITDVEGKFSISAIPPGAFTLRVTAGAVTLAGHYRSGARRVITTCSYRNANKPGNKGEANDAHISRPRSLRRRTAAQGPPDRRCGNQHGRIHRRRSDAATMPAGAVAAAATPQLITSWEEYKNKFGDFQAATTCPRPSRVWLLQQRWEELLGDARFGPEQPPGQPGEVRADRRNRHRGGSRSGHQRPAKRHLEHCEKMNDRVCVLDGHADT